MQLAQVLRGVVSMKLVEREDGSGLVAALEILKTSPKIAKMIEKGETSTLQDELESSVSYYRMQTMNQSLLALLVHGTISYQEAMRQSLDPEELSLMLRKLFPRIVEQGEAMSPTTSDFSQILELQQVQKLYEEQEERTKHRLEEKEQELEKASAVLDQRTQLLHERDQQVADLTEQLEKLEAQLSRVRIDSQERIDKLTERIKELNQRILAAK